MSLKDFLPVIFILVFAAFAIFFLWMFLRVVFQIMKAIIKIARHIPQAAVFILRLIRNTPHAAAVTSRYIQKYPSVLALVASNTTPLLGVYFFKWDIFSILILYWLESAVVGFYNVLKLRKAAAPSTPEEIDELRGYRTGWKSAAMALNEGKLAKFFIQQYAVFMAAHALFLGIFFFALTESKLSAPLQFTPLALLSTLGSVAALFASHGISYAVNFIGKQEFLSVSPAWQMAQPYRRIGVMHFTVVFGAWFAFPFNSATAFLVVLILSKILLDVLFHLREHGALSPQLMRGFGVKFTGKMAGFAKGMMVSAKKKDDKGIVVK